MVFVFWINYSWQKKSIVALRIVEVLEMRINFLYRDRVNFFLIDLASRFKRKFFILELD